MHSICIIYSIFIVLDICTIQAQLPNTPPEVKVAREWILSETDEIGSIVARIRVIDAENDDLSLTLGQPRSVMPNNSGIKEGYKYFYIDDHSRVRLRTSVRGLSGKSFLVSVLLYDGHYTSRTDVRVRIVKPNENVKISSALADALAGSNFKPGNIANMPIPNIANIRLSDNKQPPYLHMEPNTVWKIESDSKPGTIVNIVKADDYSNTFLKFTIDPNNLLNIDEKTGKVSVKENLSNEVGIYAMTITASNGHASVSEPIILEIIKHDRAQTISSDEPSLIIYTHGASTLADQHPRIIEMTSESTISKPVIKVLQKGVPNNAISSSAETQPSNWIIEATSYTIFTAVIICVCVVIYRWLSKRKKPANHKNLSVRYNEKRESLSLSKKDKIISDFLTVVGFTKRAESNKYESNNLEIQKIPSRLDIKPALNVTGDRWEFPRHKLRFISILGEGCFGQVWKCEASGLATDDSNKCFVAVKTLKESAGSEEQRDLLQELKVLKNLDNHPNVLSLLGCCTENGPTLVILEYMVGGKLQSYLRDSRNNCAYGNLYGLSSSLTPKDLIIFAVQVAKGMHFLSKHNIIHRDLAARNILVGEGKICKVADFGFARDVANNHVYERKSDGRLPIRWMAVESLFDNIFTTKSDVWSFGILLWEIVTLGSVPYPGYSASDVMRKVKEDYRLKKPDHCGRGLYNIMSYCWDKDQNKRPDFSVLIDQLESLIMNEVDYIKLDNFTDHNYYNVNTASDSGELL